MIMTKDVHRLRIGEDDNGDDGAVGPNMISLLHWISRNAVPEIVVQDRVARTPGLKQR